MHSKNDKQNYCGFLPKQVSNKSIKSFFSGHKLLPFDNMQSLNFEILQNKILGNRHCWYWTFLIALTLLSGILFLWISRDVICHIFTSSADEHAWWILSETRMASLKMQQIAPTRLLLTSVFVLSWPDRW